MLFSRIVIVGMGLIGGSLGMAIRRKRLSREVVGFSRTTSTIRQAKQRGAVDWGTTDARRAVADADLVVLAGPVETIVPMGKRLATLMRRGAMLTDVGSTKQTIVRGLARLPRDINFVGAHPLAGSELRGIAAADPALYDDSVCVLTPTSQTDRRALTAVRSLWAAVADRVMTMDPATHDRLVASASHLPHAVAFALMESIEPRARAVASRSFLDMTRIAKSNPELWDDIFLSNRAEVIAAIDRFIRHLTHVRALIAAADRAALRRLLAHANRLRTHLCDCC